MDRAGIYLHIPFCRSRCSYCDFATGMYDRNVADRYVRALLKEISVWAGLVAARDSQSRDARDSPSRDARDSQGRDARDGQGQALPLQTETEMLETVDTIYFGGGTPSLLSTRQIESIFQAVRDRFIVAGGAEITLEINPGDGRS